MGSSPFQLGPLHLADYLVRADLGLAGIVLEIAPGYSAPGSHLRDLFDFSKLLDLYALLNLPLHVWLTPPLVGRARPPGRPAVRVEADAVAGARPTRRRQAAWAAKWIALAVAKPFVRSVTWLQPSDAAPHLYPHAGLFRPDQTPKPARRLAQVVPPRDPGLTGQATARGRGVRPSASLRLPSRRGCPPDGCMRNCRSGRCMPVAIGMAAAIVTGLACGSAVGSTSRRDRSRGRPGGSS